MIDIHRYQRAQMSLMESSLVFSKAEDNLAKGRLIYNALTAAPTFEEATAKDELTALLVTAEIELKNAARLYVVEYLCLNDHPPFS